MAYGFNLAGSVDATALGAGAVEEGKISDNAITSAKINNATIVDADIASATITNAKLAGSIANGKLANSTISGVALGANLNSLDKASNSGLAMTAYNGSAAVSDLAVNLNDLAAAAVDVSADSIAIIDANDSNGSRKESIVDLAAGMAGVGIGAASGALKVDLNELSAAAVDVANDSIAIVDANDSNGSKKESIADLATAMAGDGLSASAGAFSVGVDDSSIETNSDALRIKASGVTNAMLAGSIANAKLSNSAVTLAQGAGMAAMGSVALGASVTVGVDGVLEDLDTLGAASADGEFIVATGAGAFAYESGNTARTSLGLGTGNSPQFTSMTLTGDLTVAGTTTTVNSTNLDIKDHMLLIGSGSQGAGHANDMGLVFRTGNDQKDHGFIYDQSATQFAMIKESGNSDVMNQAITGDLTIDAYADLKVAGLFSTANSLFSAGLRVANSSTIGCVADIDIVTLAAQSMTLASDVDFNVAKAGGLQIAGAAVTSTAAELNLVDGITAGTAAASKAVILDSNKDITGLRNVTATGFFAIGNASMVEADLEQLDGITAGTAAASKALVLDGSKNIATIGTVGCGAVTSTGVSQFERLKTLRVALKDLGNGEFPYTLNAADVFVVSALHDEADIINLPDVSAAFAGRMVQFKNAHASRTLQINPHDSDKIDGGDDGAHIILRGKAAVTLMCDGVGWFIF